jgi:integrase
MAIKAKTVNSKKVFEVYINGCDRNGARVQMRRRGLESLRKAEEAEFELKRELAKLKEFGVDPRWGEWILECVKLLKVTYRPSTMYSFEKIMAKWIPKTWALKELKSFSKMEVHNFLHEELGPEVSLHTKKSVLKLIKRVFQMAIENGKLELNPCNGLMIKTPETEKKVLTNAEVETFLKTAESTDHRFYPVWVLALFTGMRSGELFAMRWSDIDFETATISVSRSWNSKNGFTSTKNQKSRVVPMSAELLQFLRERKLQEVNREFVLPRLKEWERGDAAKVTKAFCKSVGVSDIRFHDLRATFITNLLARGEPLVRVMATVGHSDMETTNVYLRKAGIELQGATERLGYKIPTREHAKILQFGRADEV